MGAIYCYFAAESDERASTVLDLPGGPGGPTPVDPSLLAAARAGDTAASRKMRTPQVRWSEHGFQVLQLKGIDPVLQMATLEGLLTGVSWEDVMDGPDPVPTSAAGATTGRWWCP